MANWEIIEDIEGRTMEIADPGQLNTFERRFFAKIAPENADAGLTDTNRLVTELWGQHQVAIRERWADSVNFICRRIRFAPIPNSRNFDIFVAYETFAFVGDADSALLPEGAPPFTPRTTFVRRQTQASGRTFDTYRMEPGVTDPTGEQPVGEPDIGGVKVDQQGTPRPIPIAQIETQIDVLYDTTTCFVDEIRLKDLVNHRNEDEFIGYPAGSLLCTSVVTSEIGPEWYLMTFRYLWDPFFHMQQVAKLRPDGNGPDLIGSSGIAKAAQVFWFQPYPDKATFWDFYFDEEKAYLERTCPDPEELVRLGFRRIRP